jgi:biopolymer transport protein ExbD
MDGLKIIKYVLCRCEKWQWRGVEVKPFESTSIGDIAFLLLIFFIITSSFILKQGIFFSLPSKTGSVKVEKENIIEVYPLNRGFQYNDRVMDRKEMKELLAEESRASSKKILLIKMGQDIRYERLVDTMSLARETGISKMSLKNVEEEEEPGEEK